MAEKPLDFLGHNIYVRFRDGNNKMGREDLLFGYKAHILHTIVAPISAIVLVDALTLSDP